MKKNNCSSHNIFKYSNLILIPVLALIINSCDTVDPAFESYTPRGSYKINWNDLPKQADMSDLKLGGFTSLHYLKNRDFVAITDRGPVLKEDNSDDIYFLNPAFNPQILKLELQNNGNMKIVDQIPILTPGNISASGLIPDGDWATGENLQSSDNSQTTDSWGVNPGGVYFDQINNFYWFTDHYGPGIFQATINGEIIKRLRPYEGLRKALRTRVAEGGFAGLDTDSNNRFVTITKRALNNSKSPGEEINQSFRRIIRYDPADDDDRCMFYFVESDSFDGLPVDKALIGDIAVYSDTTFFVTEYGEFNGVSRSLLFKVTIDDSTTKAPPGLEGVAGKTFETLTDEEWVEINLIPVKKTLVADLSFLDIKRPDGIAIVGNSSIAILENNNYGIINPDVAGKTYQLDKSSITLTIVDIP